MTVLKGWGWRVCGWLSLSLLQRNHRTILVGLCELGIEPSLNIFQPPLIILQIVPWLLPLLTAVWVLTWCCSLNFQFFTMKWSSPLSLHCFRSHLFLSKTLFFPLTRRKGKTLSEYKSHTRHCADICAQRCAFHFILLCAFLFIFFFPFKSSSVESLDDSRQVSFNTTREIAWKTGNTSQCCQRSCVGVVGSFCFI